MYIFHLFRSFIPALNPIGFSASDFIELFVALILVLFASAIPRKPRLAEAGAVAAISDSHARCFR